MASARNIVALDLKAATLSSAISIRRQGVGALDVDGKLSIAQYMPVYLTTCSMSDHQGLCLWTFSNMLLHMQVYSPELVQSLGLTCARMLDSVDQGMHRPGPEQLVASHLDWLRVLFVMLINPVAGETHGTGGQIVQRLARILGV